MSFLMSLLRDAGHKWVKIPCERTLLEDTEVWYYRKNPNNSVEQMRIFDDN